MKKALILSTAIGLVLSGLSVFAAEGGLAAARPKVKPLSEILQEVKARQDFAGLSGVDYDADDGIYYEIEYVTNGGERREVKVNAVTGAIKRVEHKFAASPESVLAY